MNNKIIYLDQNKWIDLARAIIKPAEYPQYVDVSKIIEEKAELGEWIFPISMIHFFETCKRKDFGSRTRLAKVIASIAKNNSIQSFLDVEQLEFINSYSDIHAPQKRIKINPIKKELFSAIGAASVELKIKKEMPKDIKSAIEKVFTELIENDSLFELLMQQYNDWSFVTDMNTEDLQSKKEWEDLQLKILSQPPEHRYNIFLVDSYHNQFAKYYKELMIMFNKTRETIMPVDILENQERTLDLLESIPSLNVRIKIMYEYLKDPSRKVHINDSKDVAFLSTAIPYTDIIITENNWKHLSKSAKLDQKYGTIIENDLNYLKNI